MPELCRFYGIVIRMHHGDHAPPHFHAHYGEQEALVEIASLAVLRGRLQPRAMGLVVEWASQRRSELQRAWDCAERHQAPDRIQPLS